MHSHTRALAQALHARNGMQLPEGASKRAVRCAGHTCRVDCRGLATAPAYQVAAEAQRENPAWHKLHTIPWLKKDKFNVDPRNFA